MRTHDSPWKPRARMRQALCACGMLLSLASSAAATELKRVRLAPDGQGFLLAESGAAFTPWGFNYDHDPDGRLLEDYWLDEWATVAQDFAEMQALGANAVRVHLQFNRFVRYVPPADASAPFDAAHVQPDESSLAQLARLLELAAEQGLYLNLTGLGCYHAQDVPAWYDALSEADRWAAQVRFWEVIAQACAGSSAVFCYDLMNEPVVPGGEGPQEHWLGPAFAGKHFVQFITRDRAGRERVEIAQAWTRRLVAAIRTHDPDTLITIGLVPWSLDRPGLTSGFTPSAIAPELDFVCVHLYPQRDKLPEALDTLAGFDLGRPLVVEEMFPLECSADELGRFIAQGGATADGWFGFYWGRTLEECRAGGTLADALVAAWLELFQEQAAAVRRP